MPTEVWILTAYLLGTAFGVWYQRRKDIEQTIDSLIESGYLRTRKSSSGDIEVLKWNDLSE